MSKYRVELTPANQSYIAKAANKNGRTMLKELNHIVDEHRDNARLLRQESDVNPAKLKP